MDTPIPENAIREVIRHWSRLTDLAHFAVQGHGFGDDNGGFGVIYPNDIDEYGRVVEGISIPDGFVQIYGFWGLPNGYEFLIMERFYLEVLIDILTEKGYLIEASQVRALLCES